MKNIDEVRNYFLEETNQIMNWWVTKYKKVIATLNYIECVLILASTIVGCISISVFRSFIAFLIEITSYTIGLKICAITLGTKKYKSVIEKTWSMIKYGLKIQLEEQLLIKYCVIKNLNC